MINSELPKEIFSPDAYPGLGIEIVLTLENLRDKKICEQLFEKPPEDFFHPIKKALGNWLKKKVAGAFPYSISVSPPFLSEYPTDENAVTLIGFDLNVGVMDEDYNRAANMVESDAFCAEACATLDPELLKQLQPKLSGSVVITSEVIECGGG